MRRQICLGIKMIEITKREVIASIVIIAVMIIIGFAISGKVSDHIADKNEKYNTAVKIDETELFQYGMDTNVGNAFVYGKLKAVDTVTYQEIEGEYMFIRRALERYTQHTRIYTTTDGKGHTQTHIETYYTWDEIDSEERKSEELNFCGITFESAKIHIPAPREVGIVKIGYRERYVFYGTEAEYEGTIFTDLRDGTISDDSKFYENRTIEEVKESLTSGIGFIIFWIVWIAATVGCVIAFYSLENNWLE